MSEEPDKPAGNPEEPERDTTGRFQAGNRVGKRGGRPKGALGFAKRMRNLLYRSAKDTGETIEEVAERVLQDPKSMHWFNTFKYVTERAYGKTSNYLEVTGDGRGPLEVRGSFGIGTDGDERIASILAVLARAGALPTGAGPGGAGTVPDAPDNPVHETGADTAASGVPPVELP